MNKLTSLKNDIREHAASKRGIFAPDQNSWSWRRFVRWADLKGVPHVPKNFCSYWRIVVFHSYKLGALNRLLRLADAIVWPFAWSWKKLHTRGRKGLALLLLLLAAAYGAKLGNDAWGAAFWKIVGLILLIIVMACYAAFGIVTASDEIIRRRRLAGKSSKLRPHMLPDEKAAVGWIIATAPVCIPTLVVVLLAVLISWIVAAPFYLLQRFVAEPVRKKLRLSTTKPLWLFLLLPAMTWGALLALDALFFEHLVDDVLSFLGENWVRLLQLAGIAAVVSAAIFGFVGVIAFWHDTLRPQMRERKQAAADAAAQAYERRALAGELTPEEYAIRHQRLFDAVYYGDIWIANKENLEEIVRQRVDSCEITQEEADELRAEIKRRHDQGDWDAKKAPRAEQQEGPLHGVGEFFSLLYTIIATKKWKICPLVEVPEDTEASV